MDIAREADDDKTGPLGAVAVTLPDEMLIYAVRYCLGRRSYAAYDGMWLCQRYGREVSAKTRSVLLSDLREHQEQPWYASLPQDIRQGWQGALQSLHEVAVACGEQPGNT